MVCDMESLSAYGLVRIIPGELQLTCCRNVEVEEHCQASQQQAVEAVREMCSGPRAQNQAKLRHLSAMHFLTLWSCLPTAPCEHTPGTLSIKSASMSASRGPVEAVYQVHYGHTAQHQAIIVWSNGAATAQYPTEGLAVSVDPDQSGALSALLGPDGSYRKQECILDIQPTTGCCCLVGCFRFCPAPD